MKKITEKKKMWPGYNREADTFACHDPDTRKKIDDVGNGTVKS